MKSLQANKIIAPDGTPRSAASHLGLCCLPMSHKRDAKLKWFKTSLGSNKVHGYTVEGKFISIKCYWPLQSDCLGLTQNIFSVIQLTNLSKWTVNSLN